MRCMGLLTQHAADACLYLSCFWRRSPAFAAAISPICCCTPSAAAAGAPAVQTLFLVLAAHFDECSCDLRGMWMKKAAGALSLSPALLLLFSCCFVPVDARTPKPMKHR